MDLIKIPVFSHTSSWSRHRNIGNILVTYTFIILSRAKDDKYILNDIHEQQANA